MCTAHSVADPLYGQPSQAAQNFSVACAVSDTGTALPDDLKVSSQVAVYN